MSFAARVSVKLVFLSVFAATTMIISNSTKASAGTEPSFSDAYMVVSRATRGNQLQSPRADFIITFNQPTGNTVTFIHGADCSNSPDTNSNAPTNFYAYATRTNGNNDVITGSANSVSRAGNDCSNTDVTLQIPTLTESRVQGRQGRYVAIVCLLYTSPSPRDRTRSRMPSSA